MLYALGAAAVTYLVVNLIKLIGKRIDRIQERAFSLGLQRGIQFGAANANGAQYNIGFYDGWNKAFAEVNLKDKAWPIRVFPCPSRN